MLVGSNPILPAFAIRDGHRRDFLREPSVRLRRRRALLTVQGESILILTGNAVFLRYILARLGHGIHAIGRLHARIDEAPANRGRSEEHTSELKSLMRSSYAVFCLKK